MSAHEEAWRERLRDAALDAVTEMAYDWYCPSDERLPRVNCRPCIAEVVADALLPTVRAIADQRAAEELDQAAEELLGFGDTAPSKQSVHLAAWLQATADNLRADSLAATTHTDTEGQRDA